MAGGYDVRGLQAKVLAVMEEGKEYSVSQIMALVGKDISPVDAAQVARTSRKNHAYRADRDIVELGVRVVVGNCLSYATCSGKIQRVGRGVYRLTPKVNVAEPTTGETNGRK